MARRPRRRNRVVPIFELWAKYEDVAMHFNDLIIQLRIRALGGVAALSTLAGFFAKSSDVKLSWEMTTGAFGILCLFWLAIWIIDFRYYNRLLIGAVAALVALELKSRTQSHVRPINLSSVIEKVVAGEGPPISFYRRAVLSSGRWAFYTIVMAALLAGLYFSYQEFQIASLHPK